MSGTLPCEKLSSLGGEVMNIIATIHRAGEFLASENFATSRTWNDFQMTLQNFMNITELEKLAKTSLANDGHALTEDLEAILATFELTEEQVSLAERLLKVSRKMQPGDTLLIEAK